MDGELSKKREEDNTTKYVETVRMFLTEISHDVATLMERKMEKRYARISQLIEQRNVSLYYKELKTHISRIEALTNTGINRDVELSDTSNSVRKRVRMGCLTLLPDEQTGVKQRRQIRMGMLEVVLLSQFPLYSPPSLYISLLFHLMYSMFLMYLPPS